MCVFGLNCFSFIIEKYFFVKKCNFLINKTTLSKLASKKEWQDAFLKFKQSKHQF